ncbi:N-terminal phage integrase SAM-like domain-containing protein [Kitasatospora sp. NPDC056138]|uniref:N-terminal phage integrase SAM-like domain-containing protein n=1 Tax=Kitasatospora sp. NPDC056138 TaxID=3345724 RepID=UPI0035E0BCF2
MAECRLRSVGRLPVGRARRWRSRGRRPAAQTLADYPTTWLKDKQLTLKPTTYVRYRDYVKNDLIPALGHVRLNDLGHSHIAAFTHEPATPCPPAAVPTFTAGPTSRTHGRTARWPGGLQTPSHGSPEVRADPALIVLPMMRWLSGGSLTSVQDPGIRRLPLQPSRVGLRREAGWCRAGP